MHARACAFTRAATASPPGQQTVLGMAAWRRQTRPWEKGRTGPPWTVTGLGRATGVFSGFCLQDMRGSWRKCAVHHLTACLSCPSCWLVHGRPCSPNRQKKGKRTGRLQNHLYLLPALNLRRAATGARRLLGRAGHCRGPARTPPPTRTAAHLPTLTPCLQFLVPAPALPAPRTRLLTSCWPLPPPTCLYHRASNTPAPHLGGFAHRTSAFILLYAGGGRAAPATLPTACSSKLDARALDKKDGVQVGRGRRTPAQPPLRLACHILLPHPPALLTGRAWLPHAACYLRAAFRVACLACW